jgi:high-affinity nickel permease
MTTLNMFIFLKVVAMFKRSIKLKQLLEVVRLSIDKGFSERNISKLVGVVKTTVHNYLVLFKISGLTWPLPSEFLDEDQLIKGSMLNIKVMQSLN